MSDTLQALRRAREVLEGVTPLKFDCGKTCDGACCKGDDEEEPLGMLLFPEEEKLYIGQETWMELLDSELTFKGEPVKVLVCNLPCPRKLRPLACRLFPLFPFVRDKGVRPGLDPRGNPVCPLMGSGEKGLSGEFRRAVREAGELLFEDDTLRSYLEMMTEHIDSYLLWRP